VYYAETTFMIKAVKSYHYNKKKTLQYTLRYHHV